MSDAGNAIKFENGKIIIIYIFQSEFFPLLVYCIIFIRGLNDQNFNNLQFRSDLYYKS